MNFGPYPQGYNPLAPMQGYPGYQGMWGMMNRTPPPPPPDPSAALPVSSRPAPTMSTMPAPGWQGPQGGLGLADILDGPQFGTQQAPAPSGPAPAPSAKPQKNFDALGQQLMSQILGG